MAVEFNYAKLGARIRKKRRELGLSQEMLAEKASLTKAHISHIENSYSKPSVQTLFQIAHALDITANELLYDYNENWRKYKFIRIFCCIFLLNRLYIIEA